MNNYNISYSMAYEKLDSFKSYLREQGYKKSTQKIMINNVIYFLKSENNKSSLLTEKAIYTFVNSHYDKASQHSRYNSILGACKRLYSFLLKGDFSNAVLGASPTYFPDKLEATINDFIAEQSLKNSKTTIACKRKTIRKFIQYLLEHDITNLADISPTIVQMYLDGKTPETNAIIRMFLSFLFKNNVLNMDLSVLINVYPRPKKLPTVYTEDQLQRLIAIYSGNDFISKRNKAIILLASTTGMRSCDIVNLKYSDFNFKERVVKFVQIKTGVPLTLQITDDITETINDYYKFRPTTNSEFLFINQNAPFNPISTGIIRYILRNAFAIACIVLTSSNF